MKIKDACAELQITRHGLYWLLNTHLVVLGSHATRKPNGRWIIDEVAVKILKEIQEQSKRTIIKNEPHIEETIKGMQLTINNLHLEIAKLELIKNQGLFLRNSIEDILLDFDLEPEIQRALARAVSNFNTQITEKALKKELKKRTKKPATN